MTRVSCLFIYKMGEKKSAVGDLLLHKLVNTHIHVDEHIKKQKKKTVGENVRKKGQVPFLLERVWQLKTKDQSITRRNNNYSSQHTKNYI